MQEANPAGSGNGPSLDAALPLVWIDLEMTGLDPASDRILEIAIVVTDGSLERSVEGPQLVLRQSEETLAGMDEWNHEHHGASGLLDRVLASSIDEAEAQRQALGFLRPLCGPGVAPLAGNSVHQDRAFLRRWMPELHDHLHYRNVDVSTFKECALRWRPQLLASAPIKRGNHRALEDIRESIAELRHYRRALFGGADAPPPSA